MIISFCNLTTPFTRYFNKCLFLFLYNSVNICWNKFFYIFFLFRNHFFKIFFIFQTTPKCRLRCTACAPHGKSYRMRGNLTLGYCTFIQIIFWILFFHFAKWSLKCCQDSINLNFVPPRRAFFKFLLKTIFQCILVVWYVVKNKFRSNHQPGEHRIGEGRNLNLIFDYWTVLFWGFRFLRSKLFRN